jgi:thiosulfate dehydrogenase (quinone) large subunit
MRLDERALAQALLRWTLGFNLVGHGLNRLGHPRQFADGMANDFAHTFLPRALVLAIGWMLPFLEPLIGALLVTGFLTRWALLVGALSVVALSFGTALLGRWEVLTEQLVYAVVYFLLLSRLEYDRYRFPETRVPPLRA